MLEFETLRLTGRPNAWLVAPAGLCREATPSAAAPTFPVPPERLFQGWLEVLAAEPRTAIVSQDMAKLQIESTQRSALMGFVDDVAARFLAAPEGSTLAVYSRSRVGYSDMGVNHKRVDRLLNALRARILSA